jgi:competence ComEA-like helix-hairpin-helix protein
MNRRYFYSFTQVERIGFVVLSVLLILFVLYLVFKPCLFKYATIEYNTFSDFADSVAQYEQNIVYSVDKKYIESKDKRFYEKKLKPFIFDPNTLPKEGWISMGFSEKQAQTLDNYRKSGARFYKKEDLKRVFFITDSYYIQLEPYVLIEEKECKRVVDSVNIGESISHSITLLELNTADTADLVKLRGIGSVFSRRIVKYRNLLGGFYKKEQLLEVYGLNNEVYNKISSYVFVDTVEITRININTATINELNKHPYLDYYKSKAIVKYREVVGSFSSVKDLLMVSIIDENTFEKVKPYLTVQ